MAIYHASAKIVKRSSGRSSVAAAAYRSGEELTDERTGVVSDYTRKSDVVHSRIIAPIGAPDWATDREQLWNRVEASEKRKDAQLAREFEVALPRELNREQQVALTERYARDNFVRKGMIADVCIHDKDGSNPHAHILLTMRDIEGDEFGKKNRTWNSKSQLQTWRENWEKSANKALENAGSDERIDHRSLEAQGEDREPQIHHGNKPTRKSRNQRIIEFNLKKLGRAVRGRVGTAQQLIARVRSLMNEFTEEVPKNDEVDTPRGRGEHPEPAKPDGGLGATEKPAAQTPEDSGLGGHAAASYSDEYTDEYQDEYTDEYGETQTHDNGAESDTPAVSPGTKD